MNREDARLAHPRTITPPRKEPPQAIPERLWSHKETAAFLQVSEQTLHYMNHVGKGPRLDGRESIGVRHDGEQDLVRCRDEAVLSTAVDPRDDCRRFDVAQPTQLM